VVSAVCVVLGGKLQLLGRSQDLGSYVRHGADEATVEAWLYDPDSRTGVARVTRRFRKDGRNSTYSIDGKTTTLHEVEKLKRRFDVQLDNLSQFMPQEKIAEFVQMNPKELLTCTVRALGGTDKLELYEQLLATDTSFVMDYEALARKEKTLMDYVAKSKALETEVEAFNAHKTVKEEIRKIERFIPWLEHEDAQQDFMDLKSDMKVCKEKVDEKKAAAEALQGPLTLIQQRHKAAWKALNEVEKKKAKERDAVAIRYVEKVEGLVELVDDLKNKLVQTGKNVEKMRKKISDAEATLVAEKGRLEEANRNGNDAADNARISELREKQRALRAEIGEGRARQAQAKTAEQDAARRIHQLNVRNSQLGDARARRLSELERRQRKLQGIGKVVDWIRANPQQFRRKVHGPVAIEVDAENELAARVLNANISAFLQGCFVLECHADADHLRKLVREQFNLDVSTITAPINDGGEWNANNIMPSEQPVDQRLHDLGIEAVVSDTFKAPDAVKEALKAQVGLHRVYVGNQNADRNMDQLVDSGVAIWYTPTGTYRCVSSRYDRNAKSTSVGRLDNSSGIFGGRIDEVERERAHILQSLQVEEQNRAAARASRDAVELEMQGVLSHDKELNLEVAKVQGFINARAKLAQKVRLYESRFKTLLSGDAVKQAEKKKFELQELIADAEAEFVSNSEELVKTLGASLRAVGKMDEALAVFSSVDRELRLEMEKHTETNNELKEVQTIYAKLKDRVTRARQLVRDRRAIAEKSVSAAEVADDPFYEALGMDMEKLEALIAEKKETASRMTTGSGQVVEEHARLVKKVEALQAEVDRTREGQENHRREFENSKKEFLRWLNERIEKMAARFSNLYKGFGCRGDIVLANADADRMSALAINILVSYRDGVNLMPISGQGNSGGEKMACTMLYCFSLQEQDKSPPFVVCCSAAFR
jgi:structural maintenance of chromosomes protein 5